ncbi:AAA family ATPase [Rhodothermus bifroesti]|uniref:SMC family ATPase n=1 Tax=Rhodothermus marinus TaxID=29549 RepID=A0A7V2B0N6_RHOMR|nr:SMC family ATPase [Rhodothermus bifroesti]GBD00625.1 Nuclease SbcCD subunit C [bacterium HR18]
MVPVELRLKNFMSYGEVAPVLDFRPFQIACLSGSNGQGKSALLDAITWALWGEARRPSDSRKPDEYLLRIGARYMEVEFTFDLEGVRYRVLRRYTRSASGKTNRPELELQVFDPETQSYRPLTAPSVAETQARLNQVLGLDYQTFVNASFLLQGRSDEFTRKKPSERKEILARILNLERYERLAELAREEARKAQDRAEWLARQLEQMQAALAEVPRIREAYQLLLQQRAALEDKLAQKRAQLQQLHAQKVRLEESRRRLEELKAQLQRQEELLQEDQYRLVELEARIERYEHIRAQRSTIERDYERFQQLQQTLRQLEEKRELCRSIEEQLHQLDRELDRLRGELEKKLQAVLLEQKHKQQRLEELTSKLRERPKLETRLQQAKKAQQQVAQLEQRRREREAVEMQLREVMQSLLAKQKQLEGSLASLRAQQEQEMQALAPLPMLEQERQRLETETARYQALSHELEALAEEGVALKQAIESQQARLAELKSQQEALKARYDTFVQGDEDVCPVCGSHLEPAHREEVCRHYETQLQTLAQQLAEGQAQLVEQEKRRAMLREQYQEKRTLRDRLAQAPERLAQVTARLEELRKRQQTLTQLQAQIESLELQLREQTFAQLERRQLEALHRQLEALPLDLGLLEQLRQQAAEVGPLQERLAELEYQEGQREGLERELERLRQQERVLREELDHGEALQSVQQRRRELQEKLMHIGFDAAQFHHVRQELEALGDVGARLQELLHAQQDLESTRQSRRQLRKRIEREQSERDRLEAQCQALAQELASTAHITTAYAEAQKAFEDLETERHRLEQQIGEHQARLEQLESLQNARAQQQQELQTLKHRARLYEHLRQAFGKHGIPSLIIEQTLPELEARANEWLDRLTDGRMHIELRTQRDKKTGGTKETLDIIITDEQSVPRPYETFSGGEAFRIDFALRLALAQLLAERSGVRIRTLVIDEGFGTQDAQGLQHLIEVIQAVQSDFDKILVITHLNELKQAFPVRIEVEKDPIEGSRFEVFGV